MPKLILIALGGAAGALLRHGLGSLVQNWSNSSSFPYGTLAVNLVGCLAIGILSQLVDSYGVFSANTRALLFVGLLGAFTTYSTFANESLDLARSGQSAGFLLNLGLHVFLGLAAVWLGRGAVGAFIR